MNVLFIGGNNSGTINVGGRVSRNTNGGCFVGGTINVGGRVIMGDDIMGHSMGHSIVGGNFIGGSIGDGMVNNVVLGGNSSRSIKGNGQQGEEQRELTEPFDRVDVSAFGKVEIRPGQGKQGISLSGDSNLLPYVKTKVVDGTLHISPKENSNISPSLPLNAVLFAGDLTGVSASANSAVVAANIVARKLKVQVASNASITLTGQVDTLKARAESAGQLNLGGLQARSVDVSAYSAGRATVNASEDLDASASAAGQVAYKGSARVDKSTSSGGSVYCIG